MTLESAFGRRSALVARLRILSRTQQSENGTSPNLLKERPANVVGAMKYQGTLMDASLHRSVTFNGGRVTLVPVAWACDIGPFVESHSSSHHFKE